MKSSANSVEEYIQGLSEERKIAVSRIREAVLSSLPKGLYMVNVVTNTGVQTQKLVVE